MSLSKLLAIHCIVLFYDVSLGAAVTQDLSISCANCVLTTLRDEVRGGYGGGAEYTVTIEQLRHMAAVTSVKVDGSTRGYRVMVIIGVHIDTKVSFYDHEMLHHTGAPRRVNVSEQSRQWGYTSDISVEGGGNKLQLLHSAACAPSELGM